MSLLNEKRARYFNKLGLFLQKTLLLELRGGDPHVGMLLERKSGTFFSDSLWIEGQKGPQKTANSVARSLRLHMDL